MTPDGRETYTVGLIADPGTAQVVADRVHHHLERLLAKPETQDVEWEVDIAPFSLPVGESGRISLTEHAPNLR